MGVRRDSAVVREQFHELIKKVEEFSHLSQEDQEALPEFLAGFLADADRVEANMHLLEETTRQELLDRLVRGAHTIGGTVFVVNEVVVPAWKLIEKLF